MPKIIEYNDSKNFEMSLDSVPVTESKIEKLRDFKNGWSYGEGVSFKGNIVDLALKLNNEMTLNGFLETDAFPGTDGSIMITLYEGRNGGRDCLEFTIHQDETVTFVQERDNEEICYEDKLTIDDAFKKINEFKEGLCFSSESLTQFSTIPEESDIRAKHFCPPAMTVAFRYWIENVSSKIEEPFART